MKRCGWLSVAVVLVVGLPGCGDERNPEPKAPGSSRKFAENPLGDGASSKKPLTAKAKAQIEKAKQADPRGH